jgi:hypothetical protein
MFGMVTIKPLADAGGGLIDDVLDWAPSTYPFPATSRMGWCCCLSSDRWAPPFGVLIGPVAQLVRAHA